MQGYVCRRAGKPVRCLPQVVESRPCDDVWKPMKHWDQEVLECRYAGAISKESLKKLAEILSRRKPKPDRDDRV